MRSRGFVLAAALLALALAGPVAGRAAPPPSGPWHFGPQGTTTAVGLVAAPSGVRVRAFAVVTDAPILSARSNEGVCFVGLPAGPDSFDCPASAPTASLTYVAVARSPFGCASSFSVFSSLDGLLFSTAPAEATGNACAPGGHGLVVQLTPAGALRYDAGDAASFVGRMTWTITVVNAGPLTAPAGRLVIAPGDGVADAACGQSRVARRAIGCELEPMNAGVAWRTTVQAVELGHDVRGAVIVGPTVTAPGAPPASGTAAIAFAPTVGFDSGALSVRAHRGFRLTGTAAPASAGQGATLDAVARVRVALVRLGRGCAWLTARGSFTAGSCAVPHWRLATGLAHWTDAVGPLAAGRYAAYAQAISVAGSQDLSFSAARGNAISVRVR